MCLCIVRAIFVSLPNPGPRAMVVQGGKQMSHRALAAALYMHTPFPGGMRLKRVHVGRQNTQSRPPLARSQGFNKTCGGMGGTPHFVPWRI